MEKQKIQIGGFVNTDDQNRCTNPKLDLCGRLNVTDLQYIPDWARQPQKPVYTKEEVGLGNVDNIRQYSEINQPPYPVTSVNGMTGDVVIEEDSGYYNNIKKLCPYFYDILYENVNYNYAYNYFKNLKENLPVGGCTCVKKNNLFGRNYDWLYDNTAEFKIHVYGNSGRYESIGVAAGPSSLTDEIVSSGVYSELYKIVPFMTLDGINELGVCAGMNVVPTDKDYNTSIPTEDLEVEICGMMLVRYILDNFGSAYEAVQYIQKHVSVYFPINLTRLHYEIHYLISDKNHEYLLEFIDNSAVITDMTNGSGSQFSGKPYMTNFYLSDIVLNNDGTVYTPANQVGGDPISTNLITANGSGLERYNLIVGRYNDIESKQDMRSLMDDLMYTRAYQSSDDPSFPIWYTEFVGAFGLTCASTAEEYAPVIEIANQYYTDRERGDGKTWQTVHSSVYDLNSLTLYVIPQEGDQEYTSSLKEFQRKTSQLINDGEDGQNPFAAKSNLAWEKGSGDNSAQLPNSRCEARGINSVAEGYYCIANGNYSHAEGFASHTTNSGVVDWAEGSCAHAEGVTTNAAGNYSHAEGADTKTNNPNEHAEGRWNISNSDNVGVWGGAGNTIHSVGIGSSLGTERNAFEIMQNGDTYINGVGGYDGTNYSDSNTIQEVINQKQNELIERDAEVGQIIKIGSIDNNGKPTSWETADFCICDDYEIVEMISERDIINPITEQMDVIVEGNDMFYHN